MALTLFDRCGGFSAVRKIVSSLRLLDRGLGHDMPELRNFALEPLLTLRLPRSAA